ncbi:MAG: terminase large subunit domain-containing protein [Mycobacterium sp.]
MNSAAAPTLQLELSPKQAEFLTAEEAWAAFVAGRGTGKTYVGGRWAWLTSMKHPGTVGLITANSYRQLTQATLKPLFAFLHEIGQDYTFNKAPRPEWGYESTFKKHDGIISFPNGTQIVTRSLENYDDIRGSEFGWAWCDEVRDTKEEAWKVMLACLRGSGPRQLRVTSTPNGYDFLFEVFKEQPEAARRLGTGIKPSRRLVQSSTMDNRANLGQDFIDSLESSYDEEFAKQEILGLFVNLGTGLVYPTFDRMAHITNEYEYDKYRPLLLSCDFNKDHNCWVVLQQHEGFDVVIAEIVVSSSIDRKLGAKRQHSGLAATESSSRYFCEMFPDHEHDILIYGDYHGGAGSSQTTMTDYSVVVDYLRAHQSRPVGLLARSGAKGGNPPVVDRTTTVNARFRSAAGEERLFIRPECQVLRRDLERVVWKDSPSSSKREIDKSSDPTLTHASDALGYAMYSLYGKPSGGVSVAGDGQSRSAGDWYTDDRNDAAGEMYG